MQSLPFAEPTLSDDEATPNLECQEVEDLGVWYSLQDYKFDRQSLKVDVTDVYSARSSVSDFDEAPEGAEHQAKNKQNSLAHFLLVLVMLFIQIIAIGCAQYLGWLISMRMGGAFFRLTNRLYNYFDDKRERLWGYVSTNLNWWWEVAVHKFKTHWRARSLKQKAARIADFKLVWSLNEYDVVWLSEDGMMAVCHCFSAGHKVMVGIKAIPCPQLGNLRANLRRIWKGTPHRLEWYLIDGNIVFNPAKLSRHGRTLVSRSLLYTVVYWSGWDVEFTHFDLREEHRRSRFNFKARDSDPDLAITEAEPPLVNNEQMVVWQPHPFAAVLRRFNPPTWWWQRATHQGPPSLTAIIEEISSAAAEVNIDRTQLAVALDVLACLTAIFESRSKKVLLTQMAAMMAKYKDFSDIVTRDLTRIVKFLSVLMMGDIELFAAVHQGPLALEPGFSDSRMGRAIFDFFSLFTSAGVLATLGIVDVSSVKRMQELAAHMSSFATLDVVIRKLVAFIKSVFSMLSACVKDGSLAPLWEADSMHPLRYVKLATQLLNDVRIRDTSSVDTYLKCVDSLDPCLRNGQLSEEDRLVAIDELLEIGSRFDSLKRHENDEFIYTQVAAVRSSMRIELDSLRAKIELGKYRVEPFSVLIAGDPGIGKSHSVRSLMRIVGHYLKLKDSSTLAHQWSTGDKYASGLTSAKRVYVYDDMDQKPGVPNYADTSPYVEFIMVRNTKAALANMAEAQDKGKYAYNCLMVVWVCNILPSWKDVRTHVRVPHAWARRFDYVWWMALADGISVDMVEDCAAGNDAMWTYSPMRHNWAARGDADPLFIPATVLKDGLFVELPALKSRLKMLTMMAKSFEAKMEREKAKVKSMNQEDGATCWCGLAVEDHPGCQACDQSGRLAGFLNAIQEVPPIAVHQGPNDAEDDDFPFDLDVSPMSSPEEIQAAMDKAGLGIDNADKYVMALSTAAVTLLALHFLSMLWYNYFLLVLLEGLFCLGAYQLVRLDHSTKLKLALLLFPRSVIIWVVTSKLVRFDPVDMVTAAMSVKQEAILSKLKAAAPIFGLVVACLGAYLLWPSKDKTHHQSLVRDDEEGDPEPVRTQPKTASWELLASTPRNVSTPRAKTVSLEHVLKVVESCTAMATIGSITAPLTYVNSKTWLTNAHHFLKVAPRFGDVVVQHEFSPVDMVVNIGTLSVAVRVEPSMLRQIPGTDKCLVRLDVVPPPGMGILQYLPGDTDVNAEYAGSVMVDSRRGRRIMTTGLMKPVKVARVGRLVYNYTLTEPTYTGLCGGVVVSPSAGGGVLVTAMHTAGFDSMPNVGLGETLTRQEIEAHGPLLYNDFLDVRKAGDVIVYQSQLLRSPHQSGPESDVIVGQTFARTHVGSAVAQGAKVLAVGTVKGFHARKFVNDVLESMIKPKIEAAFLEKGVEMSYVAPAKLLSGDVDGKFVSPFTQQLVNRKNVAGPKDALNWAVRDYISPIIEQLKQDKPYRLFSYEEIFEGEGVTPVNLDTSTGPPYNSRKSNYVKKVDGVWMMEPNFAADLECLNQCLDRGEIPGVVINESVKAEAISQAKVDEKRQRILEVGATSHSAEIKRRFGYMIDYAKKNKGLFEMSIGINVYGLDAERLYNRLRGLRCFDGDLKMQDGCVSDQFLTAMTYVTLALCHASGMPPEELEELRLLMLAVPDRMVCVLGDVFLVNGGNPTGWYMTAWFASLTTILLMRCSLYLSSVEEFGIEPLMSFRTYVELEVLGDDNVNGVRDWAVKWFSADRVTRHAALYGHTYTCGDKTGEASWKTVDEVWYLKRQFKTIAGHVVMALEVKSLAKQLCFYRKPAGGSVESQLAVNFTNVMREASLHGPDLYEWLRPLVLQWAVEVGADESRFFAVRGWGETFDGVVTGSMSCIEPDEFDWNDVFHQSEPQHGSMTTSATNTGFETAGPTDVVQVEPVTALAATVAGAELQPPGATQHRAVRVKTYNLATTDTSGVVIGSFEVVSSILGNTQMIDVFQRYFSFSFSSITLRVQHNSSATVYGRYVVCCVPETSFAGSTPVTFAGIGNASHATHHYVFNPANNQDLEFELPWICQHDMTSTTVGSHSEAPAWRVSLICYLPLTESTVTAATPVSTLTFVANFNGVRYGAPIYQGPKMKASAMVATAASVGLAVATVVPALTPFVPLALGLAAAGKVMAEAGHTRHKAPETPARMIDAGVSGMGAADGKDPAMVSDWVQAAQVTVDPKYASCGTTEDEMTVSSLAPRRQLLTLNTWSAGASSGATLVSIPITPYCCYNGTSFHTYHPLAFATMMCGFWRGTLIYDVYFSCSAMQSGSVFAYWSPTLTSGSIATDFISGFGGCIMEIGPAKRYRIKIPWASMRPVCRVQPAQLVGAGGPGAEFVNGFLNFVVMNPVSGPLAATIGMVTEMSIGSDIVIGGVRTYNSTQTNVITATEIGLTVQGTLTEQPDDLTECWLVGESAPVAIDGVMLSAKVDSLRLLCQKFCAYQANLGSIVFSGSTATRGPWRSTVMFPFYPTPPASSGLWVSPSFPATFTRGAGATTIVTGSTLGFSFVGWLASCYTGARGGMTYRVVPIPFFEGVTAINAAHNVVSIKMLEHEGNYSTSEDVLVGSNFLSYPFALHGATFWPRTNGGTALEAALNYNTNRRFYPVCAIAAQNDPTGKYAVIQMVSEGDTVLHVASAAAADFSLVGFRFAPNVGTTIL